MWFGEVRQLALDEGGDKADFGPVEAAGLAEGGGGGPCRRRKGSGRMRGCSLLAGRRMGLSRRQGCGRIWGLALLAGRRMGLRWRWKGCGRIWGSSLLEGRRMGLRR